jgi:hypothetical protein
VQPTNGALGAWSSCRGATTLGRIQEKSIPAA